MTFSQTLMTTSSEYITRRLGNEGYTFAEVEGFPEVNDEEGKTAKITYLVKPGMRAYVRRMWSSVAILRPPTKCCAERCAKWKRARQTTL